jgi:multimeric flavodoxin WrbA
MPVRVQIIFYGMYGHIYRMAEAVAQGVRKVQGAEVSLYHVPELLPEAVLAKTGAAGQTAAAARPGCTDRSCSRVKVAPHSGQRASRSPVMW